LFDNIAERATSAARLLTKLFEEPARRDDLTAQIKELEERADAAYAEAIGQLFAGTPDPITVIKWKEIYDNLEHAVDECEDVANVLESISLKNS
ncbi:MAG: hypothetical protein RLZZ467_1414, partial [Gemmatimonadota bacterium]